MTATQMAQLPQLPKLFSNDLSKYSKRQTSETFFKLAIETRKSKSLKLTSYKSMFIGHLEGHYRSFFQTDQGTDPNSKLQELFSNGLSKYENTQTSKVFFKWPTENQKRKSLWSAIELTSLGHRLQLISNDSLESSNTPTSKVFFKQPVEKEKRKSLKHTSQKAYKHWLNRGNYFSFFNNDDETDKTTDFKSFFHLG